MLNFIGLGLGPMSFGALSDYLEPGMGIESIRWALSTAALVSVVAAFLFWRGAGFLAEDLARAPR